MAQYSELYRDVVASYRGTRRNKSEEFILVARFFFRPLSFAVTPVLLRLGLSANAVTLVNFLCLLMAIGLLFLSYDFRWISAGLFVIAGILDYSDGNIARYNKSHSLFGKFIDGLVDGIFFLHLFALGWAAGLYHFGATNSGLLVIAAGAIGAFCSIYEHVLQLRYASFQHEQSASSVVDTAREDPVKTSTSQLRSLRLLVDNWALSLQLFASLALACDLTVPYVAVCAVVAPLLLVLRTITTIPRARQNLSAPDRRSARP